MYIPKHFSESDRGKIAGFMREYNFAVLVNTAKKQYWATHLPFIVKESGGEIVLKSHMAKSNPQWTEFKDDEEVLVIFQEPHSYISPSLYESKVNVPTWNYIAVHAYGIPVILPSVEQRISLLKDTFEEFEPEFKNQWLTLPEDYKNELLDGIIAFEIRVNRLDSMFKLSQNKTGNEKEKIIEKLSSSDDNTKKDLAKYMKNQ